jgi:hypothetical protein
MLPGDSAVQQEAQPVVGEIADTVSDARDFLDQQVDRFGGVVVDSAGVELGQELISPRGEGADQLLILDVGANAKRVWSNQRNGMMPGGQIPHPGGPPVVQPRLRSAARAPTHRRCHFDRVLDVAIACVVTPLAVR